ncbi:MAG: hypothetical protein JSS98_18325 [Bacteroidetes bacterium]|nr:hypothetical protein [Bacteroidota bacterium]
MEEDNPIFEENLAKFTEEEKNFFVDLSQRIIENNEFACNIVNTNGYLDFAEEYLLKRQKIYVDILILGLKRNESLLFNKLRVKLDVIFSADLINFEEMLEIYKFALIECNL